MSHTEKEIAKMVRKEITNGLPMRQALSKVIRKEEPSDVSRRRYLYRVISPRVVRSERLKEKKSNLFLPPQPVVYTPLPDDSLPFTYDVSDDGKNVLVAVDRYLFEYGLTFGETHLVRFSSTIPTEVVGDVGSEIRFTTRLLAQEYFDTQPTHRKAILRRPHLT